MSKIAIYFFYTRNERIGYRMKIIENVYKKLLHTKMKVYILYISFSTFSPNFLKTPWEIFTLDIAIRDWAYNITQYYYIYNRIYEWMYSISNFLCIHTTFYTFLFLILYYVNWTITHLYIFNSFIIRKIKYFKYNLLNFSILRK